MDLIDYLEQIVEWHAQHNSNVAERLLPGLSENEIISKISQLPFRMSREFVDLYRWRNGLPLETQKQESSLFEYHRFVPLDEVLHNFSAFHKVMRMFYDVSDFVLTFQDSAGDGYGILGSPTATYSSPVVFLFEGEGVQVVFANLTQMIKTMASCFAEGVFSIGVEGLETDFKKYGLIARQLNTDIPYWKNYK